MTFCLRKQTCFVIRMHAAALLLKFALTTPLRFMSVLTSACIQIVNRLNAVPNHQRVGSRQWCLLHAVGETWQRCCLCVCESGANLRPPNRLILTKCYQQGRSTQQPNSSATEPSQQQTRLSTCSPPEWTELNFQAAFTLWSQLHGLQLTV